MNNNTIDVINFESLLKSKAFTPVLEGKKPFIQNWINNPLSTIDISSSAKYINRSGIGFIINNQRDNIFCIDIDSNSQAEREEALNILGMTENELQDTLTIKSPKEFRSKHLFFIETKKEFSKSQYQLRKGKEDKKAIFEIFFKNKQVVIEGDYIDDLTKEKIGTYQSNNKDIKPFDLGKLESILAKLENSFIPEKTEKKEASKNLNLEEFIQYCKGEIESDTGYYPQEIIFNDEFQRFGKNKRGAYIAGLYIDRKGREQAYLSFTYWNGPYKSLYSWTKSDFKEWTEEEKIEWEEKGKELKAKQEAKRAESIEEARDLYNTGLKVDSIPSYFEKKKYSFDDLKPLIDSLRQHEGFISYPLHDYENNELVGIQRIYSNGEKREKGKTGFFKIEGNSLDIVYIAEGLATGLSVHLATEKTVYIANSCHGLKACVREALKLREIDQNCLIVICADKDENKLGENKAREACNELLRVTYKLPYLKGREKLDFDDLRQLEGLEAVKEQLDPQKLIDNFYQDYSSFSEKTLKFIIREREKAVKSLDVKQLTKEDIEELNKELNCQDLITELLNRAIAFTQIGGKSSFVDKANLLEGLENLQVWHKEHLLDKYANKKGFAYLTERGVKYENYFKIWLESHRRNYFKGVIFSPLKDKEGYLNLFTGFKYKPVNKVDTSFFWNHLFEVLCSSDLETYIYVRKWLSHIFQRPCELSRIALVIPNSGQGTGKGSFLESIQKLLGCYSVILTDIERLGAKFNSHISGKLLINANEAIWGGDKKKEGALKALITDPTHLLELKHKEPITINNYARLIVTSNEDWAVPVGLDDRRFVFLEASDKYKHDSQYFNNFRELADQAGFLESLMFDLMNENIEGFNFTQRPNKSFELAKGHKLASMPLVLSWWNDYLNSDIEIQENMPRDELRLNFEEYCNRNKKNHIPASEKFWHEFKRYVPKEVNSDNSNRKSVLGSQKRVISGLNKEGCLNHINKLLDLKRTESFEESDIPF